MLTIAGIAEAAELMPRQIRYVIDQGLVPGIEPVPGCRGRAREYELFEGFAVALAAKLLDAGINQCRIKEIMETMHGAEKSRKSASLWTAWQGDIAGFAMWNCNDTVAIRTDTIKLLARFKGETDGA